MKHRRIDEGPPRAGRRPDAHLNFPIIIHVGEKPEDTVLEVEKAVKTMPFVHFVLSDVEIQRADYLAALGSLEDGLRAMLDGSASGAEAALEMARGFPDLAARAMAELASLRGDPALAEAALERARATGDQRSLAHALARVGGAFDTPLGRAAAEEARALAARLGLDAQLSGRS